MVYGSRLLRADWIINSPLSQPNGHAPGSMSFRAWETPTGRVFVVPIRRKVLR